MAQGISQTHPPLPEPETFLMRSAFRYAISQPEYQNEVGGFTMEAQNYRDGFKYSQNTYNVNAVRVAGKKGITSAIATQTVSEGGYTYSILTPTKAGIGAIGIHFFQGKVGALFYPAQETKPKVFASVTMSEFQEKVLEEFGFELTGQNVVDK